MYIKVFICFRLFVLSVYTWKAITKTLTNMLHVSGWGQVVHVFHQFIYNVILLKTLTSVAAVTTTALWHCGPQNKMLLVLFAYKMFLNCAYFDENWQRVGAFLHVSMNINFVLKENKYFRQVLEWSSHSQVSLKRVEESSSCSSIFIVSIGVIVSIIFHINIWFIRDAIRWHYWYKIFT